MDLESILQNGAYGAFGSSPAVVAILIFYRQKMKDHAALKKAVRSMSDKIASMNTQIAVLTTKVDAISSSLTTKK